MVNQYYMLFRDIFRWKFDLKFRTSNTSQGILYCQNFEKCSEINSVIIHFINFDIRIFHEMINVVSYFKMKIILLRRQKSIPDYICFGITYVYSNIFFYEMA